MKSNRLYPIAAWLLFFAQGCDLNISNPNQASEDRVLSTSDGIIALAIGMQRDYASQNVDAYLRHPAITSRELAANTTFANLLELEDGSTVSGANSGVSAIWSRSYRIIGIANQLIENAPDTPLAEGTRSGIIALAQLYKAMCLGFIAQAFESAPIDVQADGQAPFVSRQELFATAIRLLDDARQTIDTAPPSAQFNADILGSGFDLVNTIHAYRARYNLFAGNYRAAIEAADAVDPLATSVYTYDARTQNPIYAQVFVEDDYAPRDHFGTQGTDGDDGRLAFYLVPDERTSNPNGFPIEALGGFWNDAASPIPAYLPSEMILTRAEANAMLGDIENAIAEIDAIRTKTPEQDPHGIGASLPPYNGPQTLEDVLAEIFRQRRAELFLNGTGWEDSRRLEQPGPSADSFERNRNFYPYPDQEHLNNSNTPSDPAN